MTEREALLAAIEEIQWILDTLHGKTFPGRVKYLREVQLPKLLEILKEGLGDD